MDTNVPSPLLDLIPAVMVNPSTTAKPTDAEQSAYGACTMEEVVGRRLQNGKSEYLIKWVGFDASQNSWEPEEKMDEKLIAQFRLSQKIRESRRRNAEGSLSVSKGLLRGLTPKKIIAATKQMGETLFLVQYFDTEELDLAPAKEVFDKAPLMVLQFFEKYLPG
ncbi:hypothetical protein L596_024508 [Steinernema carpocapsae]|uniref:Chromo domain-containing protein n=1 Tax=Steinernema carpocapsae TaxID=34508 RepID=A0A4U5MI34_STECR|nr:hypothetical protein L596_024508 [Steinernema carpocapsae]